MYYMFVIMSCGLKIQKIIKDVLDFDIHSSLPQPGALNPKIQSHRVRNLFLNSKCCLTTNESIKGKNSKHPRFLPIATPTPPSALNP